MAKAKMNSFEDRDKKSKKRSSIVKMSELRVENVVEEKIPKAEKDIIVEKKIHDRTKQELESTIVEKINEATVEVVLPKVEDSSRETFKEVKMESATDNQINDSDKSFFNLNEKNDVFEGKITTVRVYDDILEVMKKYATIKNYPIIEFTNKVITLGLEDIKNYNMIQISEIKLKNNTSRSIMYNLTDIMEDKLTNYIDEMNKKGYKISRNVILNVILNETLKKFYI